MNEEELRNLFQNGFFKLKPSIETMKNLMLDCHHKGFKDCWKLFTGKDFE